MKKEVILFGIIGLLAGIIITGFIAGQAVNKNNTGMMRMMGMDMSRLKDDSAGHMGMSMDDMAIQLQRRSGDDFDENFIAMMIDHHQGAIDMAVLADSRAKHEEIKQLSKDIITAQTKEIEQMKQWQQQWGYRADDTNDMMHMMR